MFTHRSLMLKDTFKLFSSFFLLFIFNSINKFFFQQGPFVVKISETIRTLPFHIMNKVIHKSGHNSSRTFGVCNESSLLKEIILIRTIAE